jgi:hypothetical protein
MDKAMLNDWEVAARLTLAINQDGMDVVSDATQTPSNLILDICGMARGFNQRVLDYLKVERLYREMEPFPETGGWYSVAGSPFAHRFMLGSGGRQRSKCGTVVRHWELLTPAPTLKRCSLCEK